MNLIRSKQQKFSIEIRREWREEFLKKQRSEQLGVLDLGESQHIQSIERAFIDVESAPYETLLQLVQQNNQDRVYLDVVDFVLHFKTVERWEQFPEDYQSEGVIETIIQLFKLQCPRLNSYCLQYLVTRSFLGHDDHIFKTFNSIEKILESNTNYHIWELIMKLLGNMAADCRKCRDLVISYALIYKVEESINKPQLTFDELDHVYTLIQNLMTTEPYPDSLHNVCKQIVESTIFKTQDYQLLTQFSSLYNFILSKSKQTHFANQNIVEYLLQIQFKNGRFGDKKQIINLHKLLLNITYYYGSLDGAFFNKIVDFAFIIIENKGKLDNPKRQSQYSFQILINLMRKCPNPYILINDPRLINIEILEISEQFGLLSLIAEAATPEELLQYNLIQRVVPYLISEHENLDYTDIDHIMAIIQDTLRKIPQQKRLFIDLGGEDLMVDLQQEDDKDTYDSACFILELIQS